MLHIHLKKIEYCGNALSWFHLLITNHIPPKQTDSHYKKDMCWQTAHISSWGWIWSPWGLWRCPRSGCWDGSSYWSGCSPYKQVS